MRNQHLAGFVALVALALVPIRAGAQMTLASATELRPGRCETPAVAEQLRTGHPLRGGGGGTCAGWTAWVAAAPLDRAQRTAWIRAARLLRDADEPSCRVAGRMLERIERSDLARVWQEPDTTGGVLWIGATYLGPDETPLGVQLWSRAFERPFGWLVGALAHEAFHALDPRASEQEAEAFGARCAGRVAGSAATIAQAPGFDVAGRLPAGGPDY